MMIYLLSIPAPFSDASQSWFDPDDVVDWVRVDSGERDLIGVLVSAAMHVAEEECKQPLFQREHSIVLSGFTSGSIPSFIIDEGSLTITYRQKGSDEDQAVSAADYTLLNGKLTFSDALLALPDIASVTIRVKLGFTSAALPANIRLAVQMMVADFYDNRGNGAKQLPTAAQYLLAGYKRFTC